MAGAEGTQSGCCEGERFKQRQTESAQVMCVQGQVLGLDSRHFFVSSLHRHTLAARHHDWLKGVNVQHEEHVDMSV